MNGFAVGEAIWWQLFFLLQNLLVHIGLASSFLRVGHSPTRVFSGRISPDGIWRWRADRFLMLQSNPSRGAHQGPIGLDIVAIVEANLARLPTI